MLNILKFEYDIDLIFVELKFLDILNLGNYYDTKLIFDTSI